MTKEQLRRDWIDRSVNYYSKVMRENRRRGESFESSADRDSYYHTLATRHYFALRKIKDGKPKHAELIYRRIIDEHLMGACEVRPQEMSTTTAIAADCDHAKLAITTLLLALVLQRLGASAKQTRSVFLKFFRVIASETSARTRTATATNDSGRELRECACSAKVMGAFALFEMKQGNTLKSLQLAQLARQLDPTVMKPLLNWKQFRDAASASLMWRSSKDLKRGMIQQEERVNEG